MDGDNAADLDKLIQSFGKYCLQNVLAYQSFGSFVGLWPKSSKNWFVLIACTGTGPSNFIDSK